MPKILRRQEDVIGLPDTMSSKESSIAALEGRLTTLLGTGEGSVEQIATSIFNDGQADNVTVIDALTDNDKLMTSYVNEGSDYAFVWQVGPAEDDARNRYKTAVYDAVASKVATLKDLYTVVSSPDATVEGSLAKLFSDFINDENSDLKVSDLADMINESATLSTTLTELAAVSAENLKTTIRDGAEEAYDTYAEVLAEMQTAKANAVNTIASEMTLANQSFIKDGPADLFSLTPAKYTEVTSLSTIPFEDSVFGDESVVTKSMLTEAVSNSNKLQTKTVVVDDGNILIMPELTENALLANFERVSVIKLGVTYDLPVTLVSAEDGSFEIDSETDFTGLTATYQFIN